MSSEESNLKVIVRSVWRDQITLKVSSDATVRAR
jgi:hypothetical protein